MAYSQAMVLSHYCSAKTELLGNTEEMNSNKLMIINIKNHQEGMLLQTHFVDISDYENDEIKL